MFSHRIHRTHRTFLLGYSPTDFTDLHRIFLLGYSPTDFTHRSYGAFKGVHLSPLGFALPEQEVHQHNKIYILPQNSKHILAGIFSHRFHRFTQNFLLRKLPQISQNTQNFLAEKNSVQSVDSVGSIRTLTSVRICEICGSFFNCKLRVKSVGVFQLQT